MKKWLTNKDIVELTGLKYKTLYKYRARAVMPTPDIYIGNKPLWRNTTIEDWVSKRNAEVGAG